MTTMTDEAGRRRPLIKGPDGNRSECSHRRGGQLGQMFLDMTTLKGERVFFDNDTLHAVAILARAVNPVSQPDFNIDGSLPAMISQCKVKWAGSVNAWKPKERVGIVCERLIDESDELIQFAEACGEYDPGLISQRVRELYKPRFLKQSEFLEFDPVHEVFG